MPSKQPTPLHIFKPGKWTTMAGEVIEFSQADIEATAKAYNPDLCKAPLVVGHPKTDDPAQGWAESLKATARGLFAMPAKVDPAFADSVTAGRYGAISAKFFRPTEPSNPVPGVWYLRHIGFLGAATPAVKGLDAPAFSDLDDGCVCFQEAVALSAWDDVTNASLFRSLRDWFIGKFGQEEADRALPGYQVGSLEIGAQDELREEQTQAAPIAFSESNQEKTVTPEQAAQLQADNERLSAELAATKVEKAAVATKTRHEANVAFCEAIPANKLPPAWRATAVATLNHLGAAESPVEFGEGDQKAPLLDKFKEFLQALPEVVPLTEFASKEKAGDVTVDFADAQSISDAATALVTQAEAEGKSLTHTQAVALVTSKKPQ